jgi:hypothetical protein
LKSHLIILNYLNLFQGILDKLEVKIHFKPINNEDSKLYTKCNFIDGKLVVGAEYIEANQILPGF